MSLRLLKKGLKITIGTFFGITGFSLAYLQYINSQIGPLNLEKDAAIKHYKEKMNMNDREATKTYYWVLLKIAEARLFGYYSYSYYCRHLNKKIINFSIQNY